MRELTPLIKRADEIQAHNPLMAYYCAFAPAHLHASRRPTPNARRARALFSFPRARALLPRILVLAFVVVEELEHALLPQPHALLAPAAPPPR